MPSVSLAAGTVNYADEGAGPAVVLLHATLHDHHDFDPIIGPLAERHRVLAVDWPHHGQSGPLAEGRPISAVGFSDVLAEFVQELDLPPAVFIGNSVGGVAASRLAIDQPERVAGLVLVNSGGYTTLTPFVRAFCSLYGRPAINRTFLPLTVPLYMRSQSAHDREVSARVKARARSAEGAAVASSLWRSFGQPETSIEAERITQPTLLLWGKHDHVATIRDAKNAVQRLPNARLVPLRTGHVPFSSRPAEFLAEALPFIDAAFAATPSAVRAS